jgi:hypothetical protein
MQISFLGNLAEIFRVFLHEIRRFLWIFIFEHEAGVFHFRGQCAQWDGLPDDRGKLLNDWMGRAGRRENGLVPCGAAALQAAA